MRDTKRRSSPFFLLVWGVLLTLAGAPVLAQEAAGRPYLAVTGSAVTSPPLVDLHVYGLDAQGNPLDMTQHTLKVTHNGTPAGPITVNGRYKGGTFTIFLIDIPPGVSGQLTAVQDAIKQYASAPTMEENTDAVAIYKAGETAAAQLLAPDTFYNSVRNLFATPLEPETGATALVDSLGGLLQQIDGLKPEPGMVPAIVVMSDGTDVVSTRFDENNIAGLAAGLGVPIHTVWLANEELSPASQQFGQDYLAGVAAGSRGLTAHLSDSADLAAIWNRIASFREQVVVSYPVDDLAAGDFPVELSLDGSLVTRAETTITVPGNLPLIAIDLPPESRELSLPDLEPVELRFSTSVSWLDGEERELAVAQLLVNGLAYDVPVADFDQFDVEINNLTFGDNLVQLAVLDAQGLRVTSPAVGLVVNEGATSLPPELRSGLGIFGVIGRIFLTLFILVLLAGVGFFAWRQGWLSRLGAAVPRGPSRRRPPPEAPPTKPVIDAIPTRTIARLEVLEAVTQTPTVFTLGKAVEPIGRSPTQAGIAFENDITVSRLHASLHLEGDHYRIFDERSTSGTWVNDQQVPEYGIQLMDGDEIHLGAVHLRFRQP